MDEKTAEILELQLELQNKVNIQVQEQIKGLLATVDTLGKAVDVAATAISTLAQKDMP